MRLLSLFSGIGGLDAAVEHALDCVVVTQCESDPYCRQVLARHWPGVDCLPDVREMRGHPGGADIICGGFPCTDLSVAGKQVGMDGARSGLWSEYARIIREVQPKYVFIENVPPLYRRHEWRLLVETALTAAGYRFVWFLCSAFDAGAPHLRRRCFLLAAREGEPWPSFWGVCGGGDGSAAERWPTPVVSDARGSGSRSLTGSNAHAGESLTDAIRVDRAKLADKWPTPIARDADTRGQGSAAEGTASLATVVGWASPAARDVRSGKGRQANGHTPQLPEQVSGMLNPAWVASLMGLPVDWTLAEGPRQQASFPPAWPMGRVRGLDGASPQHPWEPPRTVGRGHPHRTAQLRALGNAVVPQQAVLALAQILGTRTGSLA